MKKYLFFITVAAFAALLNGAFLSSAYAGECSIRSDRTYVDGCSGPWLPNVHMQGINLDLKKLFKPACDRHDQCYNTCGCDKGHCDNIFKHKMDQICGHNYPYDPVTVMGHNVGDKNGVKRATCLSAAVTFYEAVNTGGGSSYRADQSHVCKAPE